MKLFQSGMWKSTKFVQWAVVSLISIIIFILVFAPKYAVYLEALEKLIPGEALYEEYLALFLTISDRIDATWIILLGAMGAGTIGYGIFNQIQKYSPTEKIKAQTRFAEGGSPDPEEDDKFTGIIMERTYYSDRTLSKAVAMKDGQKLFDFVTLELPWKNNERKISCVSPGIYEVVVEDSARFGRKLPELKNVEGRSEIKFHGANYPHELEGCIAPGMKFADLDKDGIMDVQNSWRAVDLLIGNLPEKYQVKILGDVS